MSWLYRLYQTYESNSDRVGVFERKYNGQEYTLVPISHTTQKAHIEVEITEDGEFHSATVIEEDGDTVIPCTEKSASRTGLTVAPYPLHDNLGYVAGDFVAYGGQSKAKENPFHVYLENLREWAESPYVTDKVKSIYRYVSKGRLIEDLLQERILFLDAQGTLISTWNAKAHAELSAEKPLLYKVLDGEAKSAFVRFNVRSLDDYTPVWKDPTMYESFIQYYREQMDDRDLCYVAGEWLPKTTKHPTKIRHAADMAKLISANDDKGLTYRGRLSESDEVACISYEVSQKAHNALKWLIQRQGKKMGDRVFLVWGNDDTHTLDLLEDTFSLVPTDYVTEVEKKSYTHEELAHELAKALDGYQNKLADKSFAKVTILVLDHATTGRMAVLYYRDMDKELYFEKLVQWHSTCAWLQRYKLEHQYLQFYGAPSTKDIAFAAYGPKADAKVVKACVERLLPCIVDGQKIPFDIVRSAVQRASRPTTMEEWEWEKTLNVACSIVNKQLIDQKEGYSVSLDTETNDRSYLFGRLLAVADALEKRALRAANEKRPTNAARYMQVFPQQPEKTWKVIQESLLPYQNRLGQKASDLNRIIDDIMEKFDYLSFNNAPLSGKYLLAFSCQRNAIYQKKEDKESKEE
ncbi:MAG TPA: type I-C CRISPR-associated protein Cas8c/Csd1 [Bacillota bacterium]|nr:type I-C CRISPR-associated protein Cas8c/Csd1 [Bacillota bacterium]